MFIQKDKASFTSADSLPVKLLRNIKILDAIQNGGIIPPAHIQLIPTNRCNLKCSFCSCAGEDRSVEMSFKQMNDIVKMIVPWMTQSVTITGGGEPLLYPYLFDLFARLSHKGIKIGLVTNGLLLHKQSVSLLKKLTWCRISYGDEREHWDSEFVCELIHTIKNTPTVDWAFSYVVSSTPDIQRITEIIQSADLLGFTHIRLVADLLCPDEVPMMSLKRALEDFLKDIKVPVIFQDRATPEKGGDCRICYLKPVITPDAKVYACCGAQYAFEVPSKKFPEELCLGNAVDLPQIIKERSFIPFEGAKHCVKCYYGEYNRALSMLLIDLKHKEFI
jgi:organic radical activating enzyme